MAESSNPFPPLDAEFELGEPLGRGAMGSVFRARARTTGRQVALKILHAETASAASRFLREGLVTAGLQHPGIVRVHSIGTFRGRPCLAYELVPGARSFEEAVRSAPEEALPLLAQAAQALGAAHAQGLTHRDVKSENLLVDDTGRLRVTDFGIVAGEDLSRLTLSGVWVGTPQAMAPEQFGARAKIGPPTDVWALGVLLYWCLAGRYPFEGAESMIQLASAVSRGDFQRPSRVRPTPRPLEQVCLKALSLKPTERFADGGAFAAALEAAAKAGDPPKIRPVALALLCTALGLALPGLALLGASALRSTDPLAGAPLDPVLAEAPARPRAAPSASGTERRTTPLEEALAWHPVWPAPVPAEILDRRFSSAQDSFQHLLYGLQQRQPGAESIRRAAQALLSGRSVDRDVEGALALLRHGAQSGQPDTYHTLIEALRAEGLRREELVWLGRMALHNSAPWELHQVWSEAHSRGPRAEAAAQIWDAIPAPRKRRAILRWVEGRLTPADSPKAEGEERVRFLVETLVEGWLGEEGLLSDWELGACLDRLEPALRSRCVGHAAPSRRLARLCLRRGDADLVTLSVLPTLAQADQAWLIEALESSLTLESAPECLRRLVSALRHAASQAARHWVAYCEVRGLGTKRSDQGLQTLVRLHRQGDWEAGALLIDLLPGGGTLRSVQSLLAPGVAAGHPGSMSKLAKAFLTTGEIRRREEAISLFQRAAKAGNAPAHLALARLLRATPRGAADFVAAHDHLVAAAEQSPEARYRLAQAQEIGLGCERDLGAALRSAVQAAWEGHLPATFLSARLERLVHESADGGERKGKRQLRFQIQHARAQRMLWRAKSRGMPGAELALAKHALTSPTSAQQALNRLKALAQADPSGEAAVEFARALLSQGRPSEGEQALRRLSATSPKAVVVLARHLPESKRDVELDSFLEAGAAKGSIEHAIRAAQRRYAHDPEGSRRILLRAGSSGRPQGLVILGELLWESGQPEARREAWELWLRADSLGNRAAARLLGAHEWPQ